jgi:hypothetical protein
MDLTAWPPSLRLSLLDPGAADGQLAVDVTAPAPREKACAYSASFRGSPNRDRRLRSPNQVMAETWFSVSVSTMSP